MTGCTGCAGPLPPADSRPTVRFEASVFHIACAPSALLESATEEYRAIVRKGVRYFVEKYSGPSPEGSDVGARFLELGHSLEAEQARRSSG
ncbi:MAG: hypothetical protein WB947_01670 [Thermoplasmata archaeon]